MAGITSEIDPVLVLSGVTSMEMLQQYAYRPYLILGGVYEIPDDDESHMVTDEDMEVAARRVSSPNKITQTHVLIVSLVLGIIPLSLAHFSAYHIITLIILSPYFVYLINSFFDHL